MHKNKAAAILAMKFEKHTQVYRGLLVEEKTWSNASASITESVSILKEKKDAELRVVSE